MEWYREYLLILKKIIDLGLFLPYKQAKEATYEKANAKVNAGAETTTIKSILPLTMEGTHEDNRAEKYPDIQNSSDIERLYVSIDEGPSNDDGISTLDELPSILETLMSGTGIAILLLGYKIMFLIIAEQPQNSKQSSDKEGSVPDRPYTINPTVLVRPSAYNLRRLK
ncbi:hypothetical protein OROMI_009508 [Orobanche minor]